MCLRFTMSYLLMGLVVTATGAQEPTKASYQELLERVKKADPKVDFGALRMAFTATAAYNPYGLDQDRPRMRAAFAKKDFDKALEFAEKLLGKNYPDIEAHRVAWRAHTELQDPDKAKFHRYVRDGLVQSILKSGDGKGAQTAYVVISTEEEYAVMEWLGVRSTKQALIQEQGHKLDRHEGVNEETNQRVTLYFNIDRPFQWLEEAFKKKD